MGRGCEPAGIWYNAHPVLLLLAPPLFQLFLPRDCFVHVSMAFEPDQTLAVVARGEPVVLSPFVLEDALSRLPVTPI